MMFDNSENPEGKKKHKIKTSKKQNRNRKRNI